MEIHFPELKGVEFYLCGGAVRDKILNNPVKDLDFVMITDMTYNEVINKIEKEGRIFLAKPEFLTIRCKLQNNIYDLVFPRGDGHYEDSRHPNNVVRLNSLCEDSQRRDFTMNALYMDVDGNIIDYMHGKRHIFNRCIVACGNPDDRFKEDALRMLRALRFEIQLNFDLNDKCVSSIHKYGSLLENISVDRIRDEINKMLLMDPYMTLKRLHEFNMRNILLNKNLHFQATNKRIGGITCQN